MSDDEATAEHRISHGYGWIWAVPVAAVAIALWLGIRSWVSAGPEVTVIFPVIADVKPNSTNVTFRGLQVGDVDDVELEHDLKHLRVTLGLKAAMAGELGPGTKFWISGTSPSFSNLGSLKSIVSGPVIEVDPQPGPPQHIYAGLTDQPELDFDEQGTDFILHGNQTSGLKRGSEVDYLGANVGVVRDMRMTGAGGFDFDAFVKRPYDRLVHTGTRFWNAGPVSLDTGGTGPTLQFTSLPALVQGAVQFATPEGPAAGPAAAALARFPLYGGQQAALFAPGPDAVLYRVRFTNAAGALAPNAAVTLDGTRIGSVVAAALFYDPGSGHVGIDATIALEPSRIRLGDGAAWTAPRAQMDAMLNRLIGQGLAATMTASPPVAGGQTVELRITPGKSGALIPASAAEPIPEIPTAQGGDVAGILATVSDITTKVDELPIRQIGRNAERVTANAGGITAEVKRQIPPTLDRVRATLAQATQTLAGVQALLAEDSTALNDPQAAGVPETLYEVKAAAQSIRDLVDFLDRHPSAILTGRGSQD